MGAMCKGARSRASLAATHDHGQLVAHNELQRHCDNQRKRIGELEGLYADAKAENAELRELVSDMWFWHYCGHIDSASQEQQMEHIDEVLDRMRELGVEAVR